MSIETKLYVHMRWCAFIVWNLQLVKPQSFKQTTNPTRTRGWNPPPPSATFAGTLFCAPCFHDFFFLSSLVQLLMLILFLKIACNLEVWKCHVIEHWLTIWEFSGFVYKASLFCWEGQPSFRWGPLLFFWSAQNDSSPHPRQKNPGSAPALA